MRIVAFSDGHVGEYLEGHVDTSTGLNSRLLDTLNVWTWAHQLAVDKKADLVLFGGDRFKPKRPPTWMRDLADARLTPFRDSKIPLAMLKGNHDMWDKGGRWHSYGGIGVWRKDDEPLWVFDKPGTLDLNGLCVSFLPYGEREIDESGLNPEGNNLLIFHDDVSGLSNYGSHIAMGGHQQSLVDREEFLLVLGGHVHLRQELPFKRTTGFHIGSPLERIEDGDQGPKGALVIDIGDNIDMEFVESPLPKIVRTVFSWKGDLDECIATVPTVAGNIVQLTVQHTGSVPHGLRRDILKRLRADGVASANVRLQAEFTSDLSTQEVQIERKETLKEEALEWARVTTEDEKLVGYLEHVMRLAEAK